MVEVFKYEKRYWYPHMKPADVVIWERFIEKNPKAYETCLYDYHVGEPPPFNPLMDEDEDLNQDALYRLKIDVVGQKASHFDIIEIKPNAGPSAIGQVKAYAELFNVDDPFKTKLNCVIITDKIRPNMEYLCKQENVRLEIV